MKLLKIGGGGMSLKVLSGEGGVQKCMKHNILRMVAEMCREKSVSRAPMWKEVVLS